MNDRPVIYVSGPMTGLPDLGHGALKAMTAALRAAGFAVVCPTETPPPVRRDGAEPTHADWMRASIRRLADCDVMVRLDGWDRSKGCNGETDAASQMWIRIYGQQGRTPAEMVATFGGRRGFDWDRGRAP